MSSIEVISQLFEGSAEFEQDAESAARPVPVHVAVLVADDSARATFKAAISNQDHFSVPFGDVASGWATDRALLFRAGANT